MKFRSMRFVVALAAAFALPAAFAQDPTARALQVIDQLDAGQYEDVAATFDEGMASATDAAGLGQIWASLPQQLGAQQSRGEPVASQRDGYDVVVVPVQYERATANVIVSFDGEGRLAGLFIQPAETAPAAAPQPDEPEETR